ncbi:MAG: hypothetical protein DSZ19_02585 [Candidatus Thioglobus sp.]|nr:MAG: hypothetical protein DSZ15_01855 [Candidatus Thioglobus sp.]RUM80799.1 MAG: hypothetical protein DSZ16_05795 [Candidatus Thioglobus sp.]RUM84914.1 MAG: hypothetical protein DSZ19_02585 [Candidatus Thioglobus sp.]RUM86376.1 MAG: hypothetical protein DSZ20_02555 [Candidatus Thioglobus sp.]
MMKNILSIMAVFSLTTNVMAGGDDRDMGPVESFDSLAPVAEQIVVGDQNANTMTLTNPADAVIGTTTSGSVITTAAHDKCKATLDLSEYNIEIFKEALMGDYLYNIGPVDTLGTSFSDGRWAGYFSCVESYGK